MSDSMQQVEESLEQYFLYENDPESMHLLLSMVNEGHRYLHLCPRYRLMDRMTVSFRRILKDRKDKEYLIRAMKRLINDDVNRFEMAVVLDVYGMANQNAYWVDQVERLALREYSPDVLQRLPVLYHEAERGKSIAIQSALYHSLKEETQNFSGLKQLSNAYCHRLLKGKIFRLNMAMDQQLVLDFNDLSRIRLEEGTLTSQELNFIYQKLKTYLANNIVRVYKESYWNSINDTVLERYSR